MTRFVVVSGASGGGKSTLIAELAAQGLSTVPEPGRRIVAAALAGDGCGLPWQQPAEFARRAVALALQDWHAAHGLTAPVVFDRGLLDAVAAFEHETGALPPEAEGLGTRYDRQVWMAPPWPDLFHTDAERRHDQASALAEYRRLCAFLPRFGYETRELPKLSVADRAALVRAAMT